MSGGSYDYLYLADFDARNKDLVLMGWALRSRGYDEAAKATEALVGMGPSEQLRALWKAVEWRVSGDWGEEQVAAALVAWQESVQ